MIILPNNTEHNSFFNTNGEIIFFEFSYFLFHFFKESKNQISHNDVGSKTTSTTSTMKMKEQRDFDDIHIALAGAKNCGKSGKHNCI